MPDEKKPNLREHLASLGYEVNDFTRPKGTYPGREAILGLTAMLEDASMQMLDVKDDVEGKRSTLSVSDILVDHPDGFQYSDVVKIVQDYYSGLGYELGLVSDLVGTDWFQMKLPPHREVKITMTNRIAGNVRITENYTYSPYDMGVENN